MGKTALLDTKEWASRHPARPNLEFTAPHNQRIAPALRSHRPSWSANSKRIPHLISLLIPHKIPWGAREYSRVFHKWKTLFEKLACMFLHFDLADVKRPERRTLQQRQLLQQRRDRR